MVGVVDFRAYVPLVGCMEAMASPSGELAGYGDRYGLLSSAREWVMPPEKLVGRLDGCGVDHMVLAAWPGSVTNAEIAEYVAAAPDRLSGIAAVSPRKGLSEAVREVRRSHAMGLRLVGLGPYRDGMRASDRRYYPVYAACVELGMAVVIHTAFNFGRGLKLDFGRPLHLDEVATDFPELTIIASHGGWPWVPEMVAVAWHHDNVYIEISAQRAPHMTKPGSGWETLFNYGSGPLRSRLLWGSVAPGLDLEQQLREVHDLPLREPALTMMLDTNPHELLTKLNTPTTNHHHPTLASK